MPVVVHPHGGPTAAHIEDWDGRLQYFLDKGYAWLQVNFRGSTGYGRDFERRNHGVWGVEDTWDCLAAADWLREQEWADGDRLAIVGGSYGSYMALLSVTDDPQHRFRCAVTEYGDCDIVTSWAQGDREGVQDLERMMGQPSQAREAYRAGSAVHRLDQLTVPLLIAHGERDERVIRSRARSSSPRCGGSAARRSSTSPTRPRRTASCAPGRRSTSTGGWSASSTGTCTRES